MTELVCFGLPSVYNRDAAYCKGCENSARCEEICFEVVRGITQKVDVRGLVERYRFNQRRAELDAHQMKMVSAAPVKIAVRLESFLKLGFDRIARSEFARGINPFPAGKHLHYASTYLLHGGFTKAQLRDAFVEKYGTTAATAASQVSETVALLRGLQLIDEYRDEVTLKL